MSCIEIPDKARELGKGALMASPLDMTATALTDAILRAGGPAIAAAELRRFADAIDTPGATGEAWREVIGLLRARAARLDRHGGAS